MNALVIRNGSLKNEYVIQIDGTDIIELLRNHEKDAATKEGNPQLAGEYKVFGYSRNEKDRLLGNAKGPVELLDCPCGNSGCWALLVDVVVTDSTITWANFRHLHRKEWDYSSFGPFIFEKNDYLNQFNSIFKWAG